ncbi:hypothetical protein C8J56DRAFT_886493 [Mycena floridula]|nr:hypothetical protein C8J56DRAFT_886493 [Mycena floridula]
MSQKHRQLHVVHLAELAAEATSHMSKYLQIQCKMNGDSSGLTLQFQLIPSLRPDSCSLAQVVWLDAPTPHAISGWSKNPSIDCGIVPLPHRKLIVPFGQILPAVAASGLENRSTEPGCDSRLVSTAFLTPKMLLPDDFRVISWEELAAEDPGFGCFTSLTSGGRQTAKATVVKAIQRFYRETFFIKIGLSVPWIMAKGLPDAVFLPEKRSNYYDREHFTFIMNWARITLNSETVGWRLVLWEQGLVRCRYRGGKAKRDQDRTTVPVGCSQQAMNDIRAPSDYRSTESKEEMPAIVRVSFPPGFSALFQNRPASW